MTSKMKEIKELVREKGYKLTPQRRATLDVILNNEGKHMSAEEVYLEVKKQCPEIGLATVYRTMLLLEEMDILLKHNFDDGRNRYELNHSDEDHNHHHLICQKCGTVLEVEEDLLESLESNIEKKYQFKVIDHNVRFVGYCNDCRCDN